MNPRLHFIVGIWRSGTTLLREVLGMNPEVQVFPEHFVLLKLLEKNIFWNENSKREFIDKVITDKDFFYFAKPDGEKLNQEMHEAKSIEDAILACYKACVKEPSTVQFVDKNPIYSYYLPQLMQQFPKSKFIWMLREPKDNCISRANHSIQYWKNYSYLAYWWNYTNLQIAQQAEKSPDKFLLVPYDQMVVEPESWVKKICLFLELDFKPDMLAFEKKKDERAAAFIQSVKERDGEIDPNSNYAKRKIAMWENLQKPINDSKTKQWDKELSKAQIQAIDRMSQEYYHALLQHEFSFKPSRPWFYQLLLSLSKKSLHYKILHA